MSTFQHIIVSILWCYRSSGSDWLLVCFTSGDLNSAVVQVTPITPEPWSTEALAAHHNSVNHTWIQHRKNGRLIDLRLENLQKTNVKRWTAEPSASKSQNKTNECTITLAQVFNIIFDCSPPWISLRRFITAYLEKRVRPHLGFEPAISELQAQFLNLYTTRSPLIEKVDA